MKQEEKTHHGNDEELFKQFVAKVFHRALDEPRAVVGRDDLDSLGQTALQLLYLVLDRSDGLQCILARAHHDDAADGFALAVEFADAAAHLGSHLDARNITEVHRYACVGRLQRHLAEILERLQIARYAHDVFGLAQFEDRAAGFLIGFLDRFDDLGVCNAVRGQLVRVEYDLVLADHSTD